MLYTNDPNPQLDYELVCLEHMVDPDHLLRHIDKNIDFTFILDLVRPYYSESNGRPSVDPIVFFKMLLIGYLYNIRSERELERVVNDSLAFRWFLRLGLSGKAPDHSIFSWNRKNRFKDTTVFKISSIISFSRRFSTTWWEAGCSLPIPRISRQMPTMGGTRNEKSLVRHTSISKSLEQAVNEDRFAFGKSHCLPKRRPKPRNKKLA